jgi:hypothetical protein
VSNPYVTVRKPVANSGRCGCCKRPWSVCVESDQVRQPPSDPYTCKTCWEHLQAAGFKRDEDHIELWRALLNARVQKLGKEIADLKDQLATARRDLDERPEKEILKYVGEGEIRAAQEEAQRAFASRQQAWRALSEIQCVHRERNNGRCQCGRPFEQCTEAKVLAGYPVLAEWVRSEMERLNRGLPCDLPAGHPARLDSRWRL